MSGASAGGAEADGKAGTKVDTGTVLREQASGAEGRASLVLRPGAERPLLRHHPWIFSRAVARVDGDPAPGETVAVLAADGRWLASAAYSPRSQIRARVWSFVQAEPIDAAWLRRRVAHAIGLRGGAAHRKACARRLVYGESDGLPGLVVDHYGEVVVCQFLSAGAERWRDSLCDALEAEIAPACLYERSDVDVREKEGLEQRTGLLRGAEPPLLVAYEEEGRCCLVDVRSGHKTGAYLDQRVNRSRVASIAADRDVLDVFAYTGGFSVAALLGGARSVTQVETSPKALELTRRQLQANGLDAGDAPRLQQVDRDAFSYLRELLAGDRRFDLVVLDPPKFVRHRGQIEAACRGYKDINRLAFSLLRPGGLLATFSCSGLLESALFQKVVADAALDARVDAQILARLQQAEDHPTALPFPEATYLKGLICRVTGGR